MKYMGSKNRIAKHILPIMLKEMEDKEYTTWVGHRERYYPSLWRVFFQTILS